LHFKYFFFTSFVLLWNNLEKHTKTPNPIRRGHEFEVREETEMEGEEVLAKCS
jgi:hypothetical protein